MSLKRLFTELTIMALLAGGGVVRGGTLLVPSQYETIQSAINAAVAGDEVVVADGIYTGAGNKNLDFAGKAITLRSASGDPTTCVIDCENDGRGLYFHSSETADAVVTGLTIRNGRITTSSFPGGAHGAGVYCFRSGPVLANCCIIGNWSFDAGGGVFCSASPALLLDCSILDNRSDQQGGGAYFGSSDALLVRCTISRNRITYKGGGVCCYNASPMLTDCTISDNVADGYHSQGGGVYCDGASNPTLTGCRISGNTSTWQGGGVYCWNSACPTLMKCSIVDNASGTTAGSGGGLYSTGESTRPVVTACILSGNKADRGGGVYCYDDSSPSLQSCVITRNTAGSRAVDGVGGGVFCDAASPSLTNCTIVANTADGSQGYGGGLYSNTGAAILTNCILWGDTPNEVSSYCSSPPITYSDIQGGYDGIGNINVDPGFCFADDFHLSHGSPCVDSGPNSPPGDPPADDIDGNPRPQDGDGDGTALADMGAFEYNPFVPAIACGPAQFIFFASTEQVRSESQILRVRNGGGGMLNWRLTNDASWLSAEPTQGESCGEVDTVSLAVDATSLLHGVHKIRLEVSDPLASNDARFVDVMLYVTGSLLVPSQYATIQAALDDSVPNDRIVIEEGIYKGTGNKNLDFHGKAVTLKSSSGDPADCIIDCEGQGRGFYFHSGEQAGTIVSGLTVQNGAATSGMPGGEYGGGVCCAFSDPTLTRCIIAGCSATALGGGAYCSYANPHLSDCTISGGSARGGGGMACVSRSSPTLTGCTLMRNHTTSYGGGGIYSVSSRPRVSDCTISENSISGNSGGGAGIHCVSESNVVVINSQITRNALDLPNSFFGGGGVACDSSTVAMTDCVIGDNVVTASTTAYGGGICCQSSYAVEIINCRVHDNIVNGPTAYGGGVYCGNWSEAIITDCTISRNAVTGGSGYGGGLSLYETNSVLTDCTIADNTIQSSASRGGGLYADSRTTAMGCIICGNTATGAPASGGGVYCSGTPTLKACEIYGNTAIGVSWESGCGGGVSCAGSASATITNCAINGNTASGDLGYGGALYCYTGAAPKLSNCRLCGNHARDGGGAIYCNNTSPSITNSTISGNSATFGGAFATYINSRSKLANCILWGNAPDGVDPNSGSLTVSYSDIQGGWTGVGNINLNPRFLDADGPDNDPSTWEDNDYHLNIRSPCFNAGDPSGNYNGQVDMDGEDRVMGGRVDIGADEVLIRVKQADEGWPKPAGQGTLPISAGSAEGSPR